MHSERPFLSHSLSAFTANHRPSSSAINHFLLVEEESESQKWERSREALQTADFKPTIHRHRCRINMMSFVKLHSDRTAFCEHIPIRLSASNSAANPATETAAMAAAVVYHYKNAEAGKIVVGIASRQA